MPLACCSSCGSDFVHPRAWSQRPNGRVRLELRCGQCRNETTGDYEAARVAEYDRALVKARLELRAVYNAVVRSNMQGEAERLRMALSLDLLSADDFAGYNRTRSGGAAPKRR
jgi:hypothetical protein